MRMSRMALDRMTFGSTGLVRNVGVGKMLKHFFLRDRKISLSGRLTIVGRARLSSARMRVLVGSAAAAPGSAATSTPMG